MTGRSEKRRAYPWVRLVPLLLRAGETEARKDGDLDKLLDSGSGSGQERTSFHSVLESIVKEEP